MAAIKDIAIYGAGGFGREVACLINRINEVEPTWNLVGFFDDDASLKGTRNEYGEVLGNSDVLNSWNGDLAIAISVGLPNAVKHIVNKIHKKVEFPNLFDPDAQVLDNGNYSIGFGNIFTVGCTVSISVKIGNFNTFNANTGIGHDTIIGDYNSFMPNVNISGGVQIGNENFFGVKSTVLQYLRIGNNVTIGANTLILKNAKDGNLYIGVPAKKMNL